MSRVERGSDAPRAMIHRRILDVAESQPDASLAAIAEEVSGATESLVDRVLREYGDPAGDDATTSGTDGSAGANSPEDARQDDTGETAMTDAHQANGTAGQDGQEVADLSEKQQRALRLVYERPEATQKELAETLDVTRATVSRWLGDVPGFEWQDRRPFVESLFDGDQPLPTDESGTETDDGPGTDAASADGGESVGESTIEEDSGDGAAGRDIDDLHDRVETIENRVEGLADGAATGNGAPTGDVDGISPDLAHRVVHASMESDRISEEEELQLLRAFIGDE